jgi:hypothetical protein
MWGRCRNFLRIAKDRVRGSPRTCCGNSIGFSAAAREGRGKSPGRAARKTTLFRSACGWLKFKNDCGGGAAGGPFAAGPCPILLRNPPIPTDFLSAQRVLPGGAVGRLSREQAKTQTVFRRHRPAASQAGWGRAMPSGTAEDPAKTSPELLPGFEKRGEPSRPTSGRLRCSGRMPIASGFPRGSGAAVASAFAALHLSRPGSMKGRLT